MPTTVVVTSSSYENEDNLDSRWFTDVVSVYEGTRIGRQEIMAEILDDVPGALWTRAMLDAARLDCGPVEVVRAVAARPSRERCTCRSWGCGRVSLAISPGFQAPPGEGSPADMGGSKTLLVERGRATARGATRGFFSLAKF
jgi:phage terminase large subunit-like protein